MFASYSNKWRQLKSPVASQSEDSADRAVRTLRVYWSKFWRVLLWVIWVMTCISCGEAVASTLAQYKTVASPITLQLVDYVISLTLMIGCPYLWHKLRRHPVKLMPELGIGRPPRASDAALTVKAILPYYAAIMFAGFVLSLFAPDLASEKQRIVTSDGPLGLAGMLASNQLVVILLLYISVAVLAPIAEEIIFRGFLYTKLRRVVGVANAMLWVSLVFGMAHGQVAAGMVTFMLSMCNCYMREKTGQIYSGIFLHMMCNTIALTLQIALLH